MSNRFALTTRSPFRYVCFDLLLSFNQLCGFVFVILNGYLFNTMDYGIKWPSKGNNGGVNFHGMFMSTGFVFFQGEALLAYRLYRHDSKILSKFIHGVFHLLTMSFFSTALAAMILHKNANDWSQFTSAHSWIGIAVMSFFTVQFLCGFVLSVLPGIAERTMQQFFAVHKISGSTSFAAGIVQAAIGYTQYNAIFSTSPENDGTALSCDSYKFVFNFTIISGILYGITVLVLVVPPIWKRKKTPEETQ